ncbi:AMP-binding protein [candidate division KSB1 bacterium]|nr:AMP-binding protein [candidate division KSB1 bacterium]
MAVTTLVDMFLDVTNRFGSKTSFMEKIDGEYQGFTYDELAGKVRQFALGLASLGVKHGDRVALMSENRIQWVISDLGILSLGATNVPIYPTITPEQIRYILKDAEVRLIIVSTKELLEKVLAIFDDLPKLEKIIYMEDTPQQADYLIPYDDIYKMGAEFEKDHPKYYDDAVSKIQPDDLCGIIYTSGTTGAPKGVMLTHDNILSNVQSGLKVLNINEKDTFLSFLPLCHSFERMAGLYIPICAAAKVAYAESVDTVVDNLSEVHPTIMTSVPRMFEKIYSGVMANAQAGSPLKQKIFCWAVATGGKYADAKAAGKVPAFLNFKYNLATKLVFSKLHEKVGGKLRYFISGGAPLVRDIAEFFNKAGILILEGYGLTETSPVIAVNKEEKNKFGTVGPALPGVEVKIADDGEILTRGPHVMKGYYKNPDATSEMIDADGWLHTGDIGQLDDEGYLSITDRKKNIIVTSGGKNVTPASIENVLISSQYIEQIMVVGDRRKFLSALIVPSFDALKKYADENGISYKDQNDLVVNEQIHEMMDKMIRETTAHLARFEQIKKFALLPKELTIEAGEITPSLKVKRKVVEEKYSDMIERMYE